MKRKELSEFGMLLRDVVRQLVDCPEQVGVTEIDGEQVTILEISARKSDHGKVVGRRGELIDACRQLAKCIGGRDCRSYRIEMLEVPEVLTPPVYPESPTSQPEPIAATTALLIRIVRSLVDETERVEVTPVQGSQTAVFEVAVAAPDVAKVLGKHGKTADALRRLLSSMGSRNSRHFLLEILEP